MTDPYADGDLCRCAGFRVSMGAGMPRAAAVRLTTRKVRLSALMGHHRAPGTSCGFYGDEG